MTDIEIDTEAAMGVIYKAARHAVHSKKHDHGLFISAGYSYDFPDVEVRTAIRKLVAETVVRELYWADDQLPPIVDGRGVIRERIAEWEQA